MKTDAEKTAETQGAQRRRALRVNEACELLGIERTTAYRWMKTGILPFSEIGGTRFIRSADLDKLLEPVNGAA